MTLTLRGNRGLKRSFLDCRLPGSISARFKAKSTMWTFRTQMGLSGPDPAPWIGW